MRRWLSTAAALAGAGLLLWGEHRRPLRRRREPELRRLARNVVIAGAAGLASAAGDRLIVRPVIDLVARQRWGLVPRLGLPPRAELATSVVLLDLTIYVWHVLTHRIPFLWRFHRVHHADLDLDASTALRFHFGEMALSVPFRVVQVVALGASAHALELWQRLLLASICFHHSNLRLPRCVDRLLSWLVVTPRLHGIHHSDRPDERASNWSSGLAVWDRLFGTFRDDVRQRDLRIGMAALQRRRAVSLGRMLRLPFERAQARQLRAGQ